ncbi:MAG: hypothetical protein JXP73_22375 [Deltaproteobacteria bacterium]|nr:hypothetical protein [Deltaproteobacteria bacterium]
MTMRSVAFVGAFALSAQVLLTQGCGGDNAPATTGATGGVTGTGGTTDVPGTGGDTTPTSTGGDTTPPTTITGSGGAAGSTGSTTFEPLCAGLRTVADVEPAKNEICTEADPQFCYRTCGPQSIGFKSETCTAGVYVEQSGCSFPADRDYSCYKIPDPWVVDPSCPTDAAPKATTECTVAPCTLCNLDGQYFDSKGNVKTGYCVCPEPSATTGVSKWSCASTTAWPCPAGQGC